MFDYIREHVLEAIIVAVVIALIAVVVLAVYFSNQFSIECASTGGHVHSTFLYYQTIVISTGKTTTTSLVPVYNYTCVK